MNPADEIFGIECRHHYGITIHDLVPGEAPEDTVYRLIREVWHPFKPDHSANVLDDNHTWNVEHAANPDWFSRVCIIKNDKSPPFGTIPGVRSWQYQDGPGAPWFNQEFRIARRGTIDREIADLKAWGKKWATDAGLQKDTIKGRKEAAKLRSLSESQFRKAEFVAKRWPQYQRVTVG